MVLVALYRCTFTSPLQAPAIILKAFRFLYTQYGSYGHPRLVLCSSGAQEVAQLSLQKKKKRLASDNRNCESGMRRVIHGFSKFAQAVSNDQTLRSCVLEVSIDLLCYCYIFHGVPQCLLFACRFDCNSMLPYHSAPQFTQIPNKHQQFILSKFVNRLL